MRADRAMMKRIRRVAGLPAVAGALLIAGLVGYSHMAGSAAQPNGHGASMLGMRGTAPAGSAVVIQAVGAENFYTDVIKQIGGSHVAVLGIINNPSADPHSYESSTRDAAAVAGAALVVQNGLGYDAFMNSLEDASPNAGRVVIDVGAALGYKTGDNPHLWYNPATMPRVAALIAAALARRDPADRALFQANLRRFDAALTVWTNHISTLRRHFKGAPVAVTEPVFDYAAAAIGLDILTPYSFQLAVMEGNDPAPQDAQTEQNLFTQNKVKVFIYNQQAVSPITVKLLGLARAHHIPVVGVYESMPLSKNYQSWMVAAMEALDRALSHGISTERIA